MHGFMTIVRTDGTTETKEYKAEIPLKELQDAVGGHLEAVPYFDKVLINGTEHDCVVFCNEEGKLNQLPFNPTAQRLWGVARTKDWRSLDDFLVGNIAIIYGDGDFMDAL